MYSLYLLRVFDKMFIVLLKEMYLKSKKLTLTKKLHGFKDNKDALDCKKRKWSKYSLEYFDPDKEDIKAEDPSGIICQLKSNIIRIYYFKVE